MLNMLILALLLASGEEKAGVERWDVKTLQDSCSAKIPFNSPVETTIHLMSTSAPHCPKGNESRGFGDNHEWFVYEVQGHVLKKKHEADGDLHLVLQDLNTKDTMLAEVPDPDLMYKDAPHREEFVAVCATLKNVKVGDKVTVRGVGFYDKAHHQYGAAPSCLELHPVVYLRKN